MDAWRQGPPLPGVTSSWSATSSCAQLLYCWISSLKSASGPTTARSASSRSPIAASCRRHVRQYRADLRHARAERVRLKPEFATALVETWPVVGTVADAPQGLI